MTEPVNQVPADTERQSLAVGVRHCSRPTGASTTPCPVTTKPQPTPAVVIDEEAGLDRTSRIEASRGRLQSETINSAERPQIRRGEGSVRPV